MASTHKSLRSSTADKRPTTAIADGQLAINTNTASAGLFFKDSTGAEIIKVGPVHVGTTAPNATPAAGGSSGNSTGEVWLDTSLTPVGVKIWNGSAWINATPTGSTSVQGLLALASNAETQAGSDAAKAVTPASLQSKLSDSTSTTSSTTIASSTAVKAAYDLAGAALPVTGGTVTGEILIGSTGSLVFEGATDDDFETTLAVTDPTADRTITLPDVNGTVVTTGDSGSITSGMIADGTIVNADISGTAEIAVSKLADGAARQLLQTDAAGTGVEWTSNIALPGAAAATSFSPTGSSVPTNGFYLPTTNTVAVASSGVQRASFGTSEVVFNDGGENYDFRIESDTNANIFFVDASANAVGIGTTSPQGPLHVTTGSSTAYLSRTAGDTGVTNTALSLSTGTGSVSLNASGPLLAFRVGAVGTASQSQDIRAVIDSSGRLLVGTSSGSYQLTLSTDSAGKPSTNTWTIISDERIKEEIELADLDICYEAVKAIPLKRFKWKDAVYGEDQVPDRRKLGWIAQDVEAVFPKAVRINEFKYGQVYEEIIIPAVPEELDDEGNVITPAQPERIEQGELISEEVIEDCRDLNADQLYAAMYGTIQKLIAKVETLETEIATLKAA
jgi:hypothetical protein